ncbi:MAG: type II secretion system protein [Elusimicrobiaceae bacterium]|nr:type II secretion system protein [Elusimicrobiaceae bacterium]
MQKKSCFAGGFTLIELLVVVLIIGILAAIALPQYQLAVEKSRAAQMLPIMRSVYNALALYKLEHGQYWSDEGVHWEDLMLPAPSGFETDDYTTEFWNDDWYCFPNEESSGYVYCDNNTRGYTLYMYQPDDEIYPDYAGKRICMAAADTFGEKICKTLGGREIGTYGSSVVYEF